MPGVSRELAEHTLNVDPKFKPVKQFLKGNRAENKKFPTYAPAQDHYGDCIHGLIFFVTDS